MPSKKSKTSQSSRAQPSLWKAAQDCSEEILAKNARELALALTCGDSVVLEGPMGAGKSTFARALLLGLGVVQPPEGSPTFAIAHEYDSARGKTVHMDFYRLRSEAEISEAGIDAYFWEQDSITITEWLSMWPEFEKTVFDSSHGAVWRVTLNFSKDPEFRDFRIERFSKTS